MKGTDYKTIKIRVLEIYSEHLSPKEKFVLDLTFLYQQGKCFRRFYVINLCKLLLEIRDKCDKFDMFFFKMIYFPRSHFFEQNTDKTKRRNKREQNQI